MAKEGSKTERSASSGDAASDREPHLYQVVVKALQAEIVHGLYPVGGALPSEAQLVERFGVSRHTVREAIRVLREMRLVSSRQGFGTIVESPGPDRGYVHQVNSISDLFPLNAETKYQVSGDGLVRLPEWARVASDLDAKSSWLRIIGLRNRIGESEPFNEVDTFVAARFAGVGRVLGSKSGPIYNAIEMLYAEPIGWVQQTVGGFLGDGEAGSRIGIGKGEAGMEACRLYRLASDNSVAILSFNRYRIGDFSFSMSFQRMA